MMSVRWRLLRVLWRQAMPATAIGAFGLAVFSLAWPDVLTPRDFWPGLIVLAQCVLLAVILGRFDTSSFAYLYSRGYSRDALWGHMMLASALSLLAAWLAAGLVVWTGLRSLLHDRLLQSPYFPIMAPRETWVPLIWLALYVVLIPACHYAWIRHSQPTRGKQGGNLLVVSLLAALLLGFDMVRYLNGWFAWLSGALYAPLVACLILGGRALHRSLEVRA
jgi:hypothetical protein